MIASATSAAVIGVASRIDAVARVGGSRSGVMAIGGAAGGGAAGKATGGASVGAVGQATGGAGGGAVGKATGGSSGGVVGAATSSQDLANAAHGDSPPVCLGILAGRPAAVIARVAGAVGLAGTVSGTARGADVV
jgi:hypothetical protein